jgi:amidophosphoribosyltransferase
MFASETAPFFSLGLQSIGDVLPGELVYIDQHAVMHRKVIHAEAFHPCVFEQVYFARPDAVLDDVSVYRARLRMGQNLAYSWQQQYPDLSPDVVIPVPFSANTAALSFANALGVRYTEGLYKNPFIGRTFIMPNGTMRKRSVRYKLSPQRTEIEDKKVLLVDDSIVRGTTSAEIVKVVRECGAKEVYFASTYPAVKYPCYYGIHIPTKEELIANQMSEADIAEHLGVDALLYQEESSLIEAVDRRGEQDFSDPCRACINGQYCAGTIEKQEV